MTLSKKPLYLLLILTLLSNATESYASNSAAEPTCQDVLHSCDQALNLALIHIEKQDAVIKSQAELVLEQDRRIVQLERRNDAFYNQKWFWAVVGAAGASLIIRGASK